MTFDRFFLSFTMIITILTLGAGCGRKSDTTSDPEAAAQKTIEEAMNAFYDGETETAISLLDTGMRDPDTSEYGKSQMFSYIININLELGESEKAEELLLDAIKSDPGIAGSTLGRIANYYISNSEPDEFIRWSGTLLDLGEKLPAGFGHWLSGQLVTVHYQKGDLDTALAVLESQTSSLPAQNRNSIVNNLARNALASEKHDDIKRILAKAYELFPGDQEIKTLGQLVSIESACSRGQMESCVEMLKKALAELPDGSISGTVRAVLPKLKEAATAVSDELCIYILEKHGTMQGTCSIAARHYLSGAEKSPADIVKRLSVLEPLVSDRNSFVSLYSMQFYEVLNTENRELISSMLDMANRLTPDQVDARRLESIRLLRLDATFILEDYAGSIAVIKEGVPGREPEWHDYAISKLSAHLALKEGRHEDAIEQFRVFMKHTEKIDKAEADPTTGILHTREMILGRNAKRIGDIYTSIQKNAEAGKAYEEAWQYYSIAMDTIDSKNAESLKVIEQEMGEIAKAKSGSSAVN